MKHKAILKIVVDIGTTVMLLFLMTYMQYHFWKSKEEVLLPERFTWFPPIADLY